MVSETPFLGVGLADFGFKATGARAAPSDARWSRLQEGLDQLYARLGSIDTTQQQMVAQLCERRKHAELHNTVTHLQRPWDPGSTVSAAETAPNLLSVVAEDQLRALADRFHRPKGVDLWNDRDGPRIFESPAVGATSARFGSYIEHDVTQRTYGAHPRLRLACESDERDELDNELMGYSSSQPVVLNTNVRVNGDGRKEHPAATPTMCPTEGFIHAELELATGGFSRANFLAEGGFGSVHRGVLPDGQAIAVKPHKFASPQGNVEFCSEVEILSCAQQQSMHQQSQVSCDTCEMFDEMLSDVVWDEDYLDSEKIEFEALSVPKVASPELFDDFPLNKMEAKHLEHVVQSPVAGKGAAHEMFDEKPLEDVVWDDEVFPDFDSHSGLLDQLVQCGEHLVDEERKLIATPDIDGKLNTPPRKNDQDFSELADSHSPQENEVTKHVDRSRGALAQRRKSILSSVSSKPPNGAAGSGTGIANSPFSSKESSSEGAVSNLGKGDGHLNSGSTVNFTEKQIPGSFKSNLLSNRRSSLKLISSAEVQKLRENSVSDKNMGAVGKVTAPALHEATIEKGDTTCPSISSEVRKERSGVCLQNEDTEMSDARQVNKNEVAAPNSEPDKVVSHPNLEAGPKEIQVHTITEEYGTSPPKVSTSRVRYAGAKKSQNAGSKAAVELVHNESQVVASEPMHDEVVSHENIETQQGEKCSRRNAPECTPFFPEEILISKSRNEVVSSSVGLNSKVNDAPAVSMADFVSVIPQKNMKENHKRLSSSASADDPETYTANKVPNNRVRKVVAKRKMSASSVVPLVIMLIIRPWDPGIHRFRLNEASHDRLSTQLLQKRWQTENEQKAERLLGDKQRFVGVVV